MYIEKILKEYLNKECDNEYVYKKLMGLRYENLDDKELSVIINILIKKNKITLSKFVEYIANTKYPDEILFVAENIENAYCNKLIDSILKCGDMNCLMHFASLSFKKKDYNSCDKIINKMLNNAKNPYDMIELGWILRFLSRPEVVDLMLNEETIKMNLSIFEPKFIKKVVNKYEEIIINNLDQIKKDENLEDWLNCAILELGMIYSKEDIINVPLSKLKQWEKIAGSGVWYDGMYVSGLEYDEQMSIIIDDMIASDDIYDLTNMLLISKGRLPVIETLKLSEYNTKKIMDAILSSSNVGALAAVAIIATGDSRLKFVNAIIDASNQYKEESNPSKYYFVSSIVNMISEIGDSIPVSKLVDTIINLDDLEILGLFNAHLINDEFARKLDRNSEGDYINNTERLKEAYEHKKESKLIKHID